MFHINSGYGYNNKFGTGAFGGQGKLAYGAAGLGLAGPIIPGGYGGPGLWRRNSSPPRRYENDENRRGDDYDYQEEEYVEEE